MEDELVFSLLEYAEDEEVFSNGSVVRIDPSTGVCSTVHVDDHSHLEEERIWASLEQAEMTRTLEETGAEGEKVSEGSQNSGDSGRKRANDVISSKLPRSKLQKADVKESFSGVEKCRNVEYSSPCSPCSPQLGSSDKSNNSEVQNSTPRLISQFQSQGADFLQSQDGISPIASKLYTQVGITSSPLCAQTGESAADQQLADDNTYQQVNSNCVSNNWGNKEVNIPDPSLNFTSSRVPLSEIVNQSTLASGGCGGTSQPMIVESNVENNELDVLPSILSSPPRYVPQNFNITKYPPSYEMGKSIPPSPLRGDTGGGSTLAGVTDVQSMSSSNLSSSHVSSFGENYQPFPSSCQSMGMDDSVKRVRTEGSSVVSPSSCYIPNKARRDCQKSNLTPPSTGMVTKQLNFANVNVSTNLSSPPQYVPQSRKTNPIPPVISPLLSKMECWPGDAAQRAHVLLRPPTTADGGPSTIRLIYLPFFTYRCKDNLALEMALWFSQHLKVPLDILAFVEERQHEDILKFSEEKSSCSNPLAAIRKLTARFSALLGFRDSLLANWKHHLALCTYSATRPISQALRDIYQGISTPESGGEDSRMDLLLVLDDAFNPTMDALLNDLRLELSGGERIRVRFMVAFDNVNIVPFRSLIPKFREVDKQAAISLCHEECRKEIAAGLKRDIGMSLIKSILIYQKDDVATNGRRSIYFSDVGRDGSILEWDIIEAALAKVYSNIDEKKKLLDVDIHVPRYNESEAERLQRDLKVSKLIQIEKISLDMKILLDMWASWNIVSYLHVLNCVKENSECLQHFIGALIDKDSSRHMYLYSHMNKVADSPSPPLMQKRGGTVNMLLLLSKPAVECLTLLFESQREIENNLLTPKEVLCGQTPDSAFNSIQFIFRSTGLLPEPAELQYWLIMFFQYMRIDVASVVRIIFLEVARNSVHLIDYSTLPLSSLLSSLEEVCSLMLSCGEEYRESIIHTVSKVSIILRKKIKTT